MKDKFVNYAGFDIRKTYMPSAFLISVVLASAFILSGQELYSGDTSTSSMYKPISRSTASL
jgi:hypothetical protein